jgi:hypothetical protein
VNEVVKILKGKKKTKGKRLEGKKTSREELEERREKRKS